MWPMKPARILLLDLSPAANSGSALRAILESCSGPGVMELRQEVVGEDNSALRSAEVLKVISSSQPDVIILTPPEGLLEQPRTLFQSMRREGLTAPLIGVAETGEGSEMSEWFKLGAVEFIN